ncbi:MAG: helix-turn-helix domain-containing protein [Reichenbachiella sp.]|uniref:AraC family transcriptional regulator n=1 Tax=Reichenbachiella sp. TaxID=2184521 RepID=UPI003264BA0D
MKDHSFVELFYLFGAFQGFFLLTIILFRSRNQANILFSLLLGLFSFYLLEQTVYLSGDITAFPHLLFATLPLTFLIGPLFYHFVRFNTRENLRFRMIHALHLFPFLYEVVIMAPFYWLSATKKLEIYHLIVNSSDESYSFSTYQLGYAIYLISTFWFLVLSYRLLYLEEIKSPSAAKKRHQLKWISLIFIGYLTLNVLIVMASIAGFDLPVWWPYASLMVLTILIHLIGYVCFLNPDLIIRTELREKYANSSMSKEQIEQYKESLLKCMEEIQPYLQEKLSPTILAESIGVSTADLSQVLSEGLRTNFYRFVNEYRVAHAKKLLLSESYADAKIIHVAFDCGFGNKTSFLRNFKEITGMTPSRFKSGSTPVSEPL